jgi:hypothetical protein
MCEWRKVRFHVRQCATSFILLPKSMDERSSQDRYILGEELLEPEDFQQVAQRFGKAYSRAWAQALQIVG